jgi:hypothetical protein
MHEHHRVDVVNVGQDNHIGVTGFVLESKKDQTFGGCLFCDRLMFSVELYSTREQALLLSHPAIAAGGIAESQPSPCERKPTANPQAGRPAVPPNSQFVTDAHDVNIRFYLTAKGSVSQAQNTFMHAADLPTVRKPEVLSSRQRAAWIARRRGKVFYMRKRSSEDSCNALAPHFPLQEQKYADERALGSCRGASLLRF